MPKPNLEDLKDEIVDLSNEKGPYSHNLVSGKLRRIMDAYGVETANKVIRELELTRIWGIAEIKKGKS